MITKEEIDKWIENVNVLDTKIFDEKIKDYKPFLIAYNILEKESEAFEDAQNDLEIIENDEEEEGIILTTQEENLETEKTSKEGNDKFFVDSFKENKNV